MRYAPGLELVDQILQVADGRGLSILPLALLAPVRTITSEVPFLPTGVALLTVFPQLGPDIQADFLGIPIMGLLHGPGTHFRFHSFLGSESLLPLGFVTGLVQVFVVYPYDLFLEWVGECPQKDLQCLMVLEGL